MAEATRITVRGRHPSRRRMLAMLGGAAGVVLLSACAEEPVASGEAAPDSPFQSNLGELRTGYDNPNFSHHMADIVAMEKGFLREVGITGFNNLIINDAMNAIIGRGVDWTAADTSDAIPAVVNDDVQIVFLGTRRDGEDLIFGLAPGVTVEQLRAKRGFVSGGETGTRNELLGKLMVRELGLDPEKDVQWVAMGGGSDTRLSALINGELMGSNLQERHIATLEDAGGTVVYNESRKVAQDGYVVQTGFLEENRDAVTAYLYALIRAKQYIKDLDTKDEVISLLESHDFEFSQEFRDAYESNVHNLSADNGFDIEDMELVFNELAAVGEVEEGFDWRSALDLEPLWEAQEAAGLPRRPASL